MIFPCFQTVRDFKQRGPIVRIPAKPSLFYLRMKSFAERIFLNGLYGHSRLLVKIQPVTLRICEPRRACHVLPHRQQVSMSSAEVSPGPIVFFRHQGRRAAAWQWPALGTGPSPKENVTVDQRARLAW